MSQKSKDGTMADLTIANSVVNLIQGDIQEHLPMTHIPLAGDVLGLGALAWCTSDRGDR
jgi:ATP-dependent Lon protease